MNILNTLRNGAKFSLPAEIATQLIDDALASPRAEICGLLAGCETLCTAAYPVKNVSPVPATTFYMDPHSQVAAMQSMQRCGEQMVGIYHSHPNSAPRPSRRDLDGAAYPGLAYLIVSTAKREKPELAVFVFCDGDFSEIAISIRS